MNINIMHQQPTRCRRVIALHCSGADGAQWRYLSDTLGKGFIAPGA